MKIKDIRAVAINVRPEVKTTPRVPKLDMPDWVSPMMRYPEFQKSDWSSDWTRVACVVTIHDPHGLACRAQASPRLDQLDRGGAVSTQRRMALGVHRWNGRARLGVRGRHIHLRPHR